MTRVVIWRKYDHQRSNNIFDLIISMIVCTVVMRKRANGYELKAGRGKLSDKIISKIKRNLKSHMKAQERILGRSLKKWTTYHFQYQEQEEKGRKRFIISLRDMGILENHAVHLNIAAGISSRVLPSNSLPVCFLLTPPHCLKKNGTPAARY